MLIHAAYQFITPSIPIDKGPAQGPASHWNLHVIYFVRAQRPSPTSRVMGCKSCVGETLCGRPASFALKTGEAVEYVRGNTSCLPFYRKSATVPALSLIHIFLAY